MVIAAIMAAGRGSRAGAEIPKQYLSLGGVPMLHRAAKSFLRCPQVDAVVVLCPPAWTGETWEMFADEPAATVLAGGDTRTKTLEIAVRYWQDNFGGAEDILLTHDAARPFVSESIIAENIAAARKHGACGTYIPCADSLIRGGGGFVTEPLERGGVYLAQTPQSFRAVELAEALAGLTPTQKSALTDACGAFALLRRPIAIVDGESLNFKITSPEDIRLAELIAKSL